MTVENIEDLRRLVNLMPPDQLKDFAVESRRQVKVNKLIGKSTRVHLLAASLSLINEQAKSLGIVLPQETKEHKVPNTIHMIDKMCQRPGGRNGRVKVTKVSPEEMEKLWEAR